MARAPVLSQELMPGAGSGTVKLELGFQVETSDSDVVGEIGGECEIQFGERGGKWVQGEEAAC